VACELADESGLESFTMAQLAGRLGVGVTSVYWYFRSKEELLRAIADRVTEEFYAGLEEDADLEGDARVLHHFRVYWSRLVNNPLWQEVFINRFVQTVASSPEAVAHALAVRDREVARIVDTGLSPDEALDAYLILSSYTRGYAVVEHFRRRDMELAGEERIAAFRSKAIEALDDPDRAFEIGLKALWFGLSNTDRGTAG
jgi:AcrR family transcriptional regulator